MSKFATKAAANMFCQARYEAAKSNERLSSREGAAEEIGIDRTRLARIELGSTIPYQEEVLLMADCYKAPELKGNYCREMCPLGKNMPKIMWKIVWKKPEARDLIVEKHRHPPKKTEQKHSSHFFS